MQYLDSDVDRWFRRLDLKTNLDVVLHADSQSKENVLPIRQIVLPQRFGEKLTIDDAVVLGFQQLILGADQTKSAPSGRYGFVRGSTFSDEGIASLYFTNRDTQSFGSSYTHFVTHVDIRSDSLEDARNFLARVVIENA